MKETEIHVAIVEDDPEIRQLLVMLIDGSPGFSCKMSYPDAESALKPLSTYPPDVVLMDIQMPGMNGIECTRQLKEQQPNLNILMLTVQEEDDNIFNSLCAGATGYLVKDTPPVQLLSAIQEAHEGGSPMSPRIARRVIAYFHKVKTVKNPLSERETEVLTRLCDGADYKRIASELFVSSNTIKAHIKSIYKKLHVHSRAEAVRKAIEQGIV
ncbi:MAG: response regulator transcription factor [Bacteroidota bacterium]